METYFYNQGHLFIKRIARIMFAQLLFNHVNMNISNCMREVSTINEELSTFIGFLLCLLKTIGMKKGGRGNIFSNPDLHASWNFISVISVQLLLKGPGWTVWILINSVTILPSEDSCRPLIDGSIKAWI